MATANKTTQVRVLPETADAINDISAKRKKQKNAAWQAWAIVRDAIDNLLSPKCPECNAPWDRKHNRCSSSLCNTSRG